MLEFGDRSLVAGSYLIRMHYAPVVSSMPSHRVGDTWVSVDQGSFNLECRCLIQTMPVNDVADFEACKLDIVYSLQLFRKLISAWIEFLGNVLKDPVSLPLADVKGLTVAWIYQPINIVL